uniref:glycosyltransferase family protein n=1 Tax=Candidatus Electrothrix sp. TaxID=2170559 RepID=UPI0040564A1B
MKSVALVPYCPFPADSGGKVEMWKHLEVLRSLGQCTIASAATRPVGMGWQVSAKKDIAQRGYTVSLREEFFPKRNWKQLFGLAYGAICKGLHLERAFGHTNPYHRHAFPDDFLLQCSNRADLALINYSYWARLPTSCPKVIVLLDLWSNTMWGGIEPETRELATADLLVVISKDEEAQLRARGLKNILWSPPLAEPSYFPLTEQVGLIGSANKFNREGISWLSKAKKPAVPLTVYGALSAFAKWPDADTVRSYADTHTPYRDCGVVLLPTALGMGVQIKTVEALAAGRAIVARTGAMRGLPPGKGAWIEVETPEAMWEHAALLSRNDDLREEQGAKARAYYQEHLDSRKILAELRTAYSTLVQG